LLGDDYNSGQNWKIQTHDTMYDEVKATFEQIVKLVSRNTSVRIAMCFNDNRFMQLPMLMRKREEFGLSYYVVIRQHKKLAMYEIIFGLMEWLAHKKRHAKFCIFIPELLASDLIERKQFDQIISHLPSL
jgi:hypothetical protein